MILFDQEIKDGIAEKIIASNSISYASIAEPCDTDNTKQIESKISASLSDADLYYVQSILVSSSWNKNDDIFDKAEVWKARKTPEDKPTNLEHDENLIIGHITSNWPIDDDGNIIQETIDATELPEKFHIVTGSVIYKAFSSPELKERAEKLIAEIENGTKYVSMECYFNGFDYGLIEKSTGNFKVLARDNNTAYLSKYLRAYGGQGEHEDYKIGRVLRNITFSGKGFVDKPANPDSIIFSKKLIDDLLDKKNDNLSNSGVIENKLTTIAEMENIIMNENIEKQVAEINSKLDTVSASCADEVKEAKALASELQTANQTLEVSMKEKEEALTKANEAFEELKTSSDQALAEKSAELEEATKAWNEEKTALQTELDSAKSELETLNEILAGYKMKEEEMAKKEKMMKRKASLIEAGLEDDAALAAVEQFDNLDDSAFDAITSLLAAMKPSMKKEEMKKEEEEAMMMKKKMASEESEVEAALETVETEETVDLSVGSDEAETESAEASIRQELVQFVSARLNKTSNKGE